MTRRSPTHTPVRARAAVTRRPRATDELQVLQSEKLRRVFLSAALCHELKQPLNLMNLQVEIIAKRVARLAAGDSTCDVDAQLAGIGRQIERVAESLETFAACVTPELLWPRVPTHLGPIVRGAVAAIKAQARDVRVRLELPANLPRVPGHAAHLALALDALLDNAVRAVRATRPGAAARSAPPGDDVVVSVACAADQVMITVSDRGVGLSAEALRRAPEIGFSTWGGEGAGVTLAKFVAYHHAGGLQISSVPGGPTTVVMTLGLDGDG